MSLPAYSAYMATGIDWLGKIPEHWQQKWLGLLAVESSAAFVDGPFGSDLKSSDYQEEGIPLIQLNNIRDGWHVLRNMKFISEEKRNELSRHSAFPGDIVIAKMADPVARAAIVSDFFSEYVIVADCVKMTPDLISVDLSFLIWAINSDCVRISAELMSSGVTRIRINLGQIKKLRIPYPPLREQAQIARFLDHETARIAALIEEQQRLIELLKEKRQALISHAVTKGLDPTVPMKDSGVEWLGEVPAHWDVCALRRAIRSIEQGWSPECESYPADEDGWGVLKAGCVNRGVFDPFENKTLPPTLKPIVEYEVHAGDILMSRASGSPELVGSTALLGQVRERLMLSDKIFRIHLEEKISSHFFVWIMNAQFMRSQIEQALSGGNGLANNLPQSSLLTFWLAVPPDHEQDAIAELINEQTGRIDELIAEGDVAIKLLQERRSALISSAVTGKIDVRGWQPLASAPTLELAQEAV